MKSFARLFCLTAACVLGAQTTSSIAGSVGGDMFGSAPLITGNYSLERPTVTESFTTEVGEPPSILNSGKTAWWKWTAPANGYCTIDAIRTAQAIQTELAVYTGDTVGNLTPVTPNARNLGLQQARVTFYATAGKTYRIRVDSSAFPGTLPEVLLQLRFLEPRKRLIAGGWDSPVENTVPGGNGLLSMSITANGLATGVFTKGTTRFPFKTVLRSDGFVNVSFPQKPSINNPLGIPLDLEVDLLAANSPNFAISVNDSVGIQGTGDLDELGAFTTANPTPCAGSYNVALQFSSVSGNGFAIAKIGPTGSVRMAGLAATARRSR